MDELSSSRAGADQSGSLSSWKLVEFKKKPAATQENSIKSKAEKIVWKVWNNITSEYLQSLFKSMSQRVQAAVNAKDSDAKY